MTADERVWAFSNGTAYLDWESNNCDRCRKNYSAKTGTSECDLNNAIFISGMEDGYVSPEIATRLGWSPGDTFHNQCPELEPAS